MNLKNYSKQNIHLLNFYKNNWNYPILVIFIFGIINKDIDKTLIRYNSNKNFNFKK